MKRVLLTRSRHDSTNQYVYAYCNEIVQEAEGRNWRVEKAEDENATAQEVQSRLSDAGIKLVLFNGHGNENTVYGNENEPLIDLNNSRLLKDRIVYARTCSSLKNLGEKAVSEGCKAYLGYSGNFRFFTINESEAQPLSDPAAMPCLEVSNLVALELVKGSAAGDAINNAKRKSAEWIEKMLTSTEPYAEQVLGALYLNHLFLGMKGNPQEAVR